MTTLPDATRVTNVFDHTLGDGTTIAPDRRDIGDFLVRYVKHKRFLQA
jgi:hypothetical protein